ncbi:hypothetical protein SteCoe_9312 [Stentor coeruleus]|uniref:Uncharacterized protein n=1 Tax=Stentor coeruleus TaxID=5963 RepID=A0A1R2CI40_9CILI|nr:hypothetical protein SteCoe_9312 [Stentor coeruleus]
METAQELKQTLNVLKRALIIEREERKENAANLEATKVKLKAIDEEIEAKVIQLNTITEKQGQLDEELSKAKDRLKNLPKAKPTPQKTSGSGSTKSIQALEQQNEKLMEEYSTLTRENKEDEEKVIKLKQELESYTKELSKTDEIIKEINNSVIRKNDEVNNKISSLSNEIAEIVKNKMRTLEKNSEYEEDIQNILITNKRMSEDTNNLKDFIKNKSELENRLIESVKSHEAMELDLESQVLRCKTQLFDSNDFYQEFEIKVFSLMMKCKGSMIIKKNNTGEFVIELLYKTKKECIFFREISNVYEHQNKDDRFVIEYNNKTKEILAENKGEIVARIREIIQRSQGIYSI